MLFHFKNISKIFSLQKLAQKATPPFSSKTPPVLPCYGHNHHQLFSKLYPNHRIERPFHWHQPVLYGAAVTSHIKGAESDKSSAHLFSDRSHWESTYRILLTPQEIQRLEETLKYGLPSTENIKIGNYLISSYNRSTRNPNWSAEKLPPRTDGEAADRQKSTFLEEMTEPPIFRSLNSDYAGSGYDRGHLVPAADVRGFPQEVMDETFILSNVAPQVGKGFNQDYWARLESFVRGLSKTYSQVYVITGVMYAPSKSIDSRWYVNYKVIGDPPNVAVPTHFYKVILIPLNKSEKKTGPGRYQGQYAVGTFVLPNKKIDPLSNILDYVQPVGALEKLSGLSFFDFIDQKNSQIKSLCAITDCKLPPPNWWMEKKDKLQKAKVKYDQDQAQEKQRERSKE